MNTFDQLEYPKYLDLLSACCGSELGASQVHVLQPLARRGEIESRLALSEEAQIALRKQFTPVFEGLTDLVKLFKEYPGRTFGFDEFRRIHAVLKVGNALVTHAAVENPDDYPRLFNLIRQVIGFPELERRFDQIFAPDGEVLDSASNELRRIRQRKRQVRSTIYDVLNKKMTERESMVTDKVVTMRDGRFVIPVREGSAGVFGGIQHGHSQSKSTVFLEPPEAVQFNNELATLEADEQEEIFRIFCDYTDALRERSDALLQNTEMLAKLDFYFAVGQLSNRMEARAPRIVEQPRLHLVQARHPLLIENFGNVRKVIPFDLDLGDEYDVLLISGPNTGGKTVTLKATGLLTMLALSGLPIPAEASSEIGLFRSFFADIGDHQSLENALSTFAAHIRRMGEIVNGDDRSLALIDEIGSATDPEQGSALAQAIMEKLVESNVKAVVTTHYTSLKIFAEQSPRCVNAAVQFDPETHTPTYRFAVGLPGNSFAIEVAAHIGLDPRLIERARTLAGRQSAELTELIAKVNEEKQELARQVSDYEQKSNLLERQKEEYEQKIAGLEEESKVQKKHALKEARELLAGMQNEVSLEMDRVRRMEKAEKKEGLKQTSQKIAHLQRKVADQEEVLTDRGWELVREPMIGQHVWVRDFDQEGTILDAQRDRVKVDVNGFHYTVDASRLFELPDAPKARVENVPLTPPPSSAATEIKLLGLTFDEALPRLEEFLDDALLAGLGKVRVVHGKGTGALRQKIRAYLKHNKRVVDFYTPAPEAGGDGVTVVSFRPDEGRS